MKPGDLVRTKGAHPVSDSILLLVTHPDNTYAKFSGYFSVRDVGLVVEFPKDDLCEQIWVRILCSGGIGWVVRREISVIP